MDNEKQFAVCRTTGNVVYRMPGKTYGDGQQDDDENPVWLLASDQSPSDYDELPRVTIDDA